MSLLTLCFLLVLATFCRACSTNLDCSLGGACVNARCVCNPTWAGETCLELNLGVTYKNGGYHVPKHDSWGGTVLYEGGVYHMFASEFVNGCDLMEWTTNSQVMHATSATPEGPYTLKDVALKTEHHNPTVRKAPDGTYLIFCIGEDYNQPVNCSGNKVRERPSRVNVGGGTIGVAYSKSLDGPWEMLGANMMIHGRTDKWDASTTNPAPVVLANGTVLLYYRGSGEASGKKTYEIGLASAPSWKGPYTRVVDGPLVTVTNEDPFVWQATDGHYHMLTHYFAGTGGHAWSVDGVHWTFGGSGYNSTVTWDDHTRTTLGRRERPQVLLSPDGVPIFLYNGVTLRGENASFTIATAIAH